MSTPAATSLTLPAYLAGKPVSGDQVLEVLNPFDGSLAGTTSLLGTQQLEEAIVASLNHSTSLTRYDRFFF